VVLKTHKRRELLMIKHVKRPKKLRVLEKLKKLGIKKRRATNKELELLYKGLHVKYCRNLEDNIIQDSYIIANLQETIHFNQKAIDDNKKGIETLVNKYEDRVEDLERQLEDCLKEKTGAVRAYQGLAKMGKYAESMSIDLEEASRNLPESQKNKYDFKQKHTLLESGKVTHKYFFGKKKNGKAKK